MSRASRWLALLVVILIQLTFSPTAGAIAPGGNGAIAYVRDGHIYVSGNDQPLAEGEAPSWSPDGSQITFDGQDVYTMDADGSNVSVIRPECFYNRQPAWSPNGRELVYTSNAEHGFWFSVVDLETGQSRHIGVDRMGLNADWSPDGAQLAFDDLGAIYTVDSDGGHLTALTSPSYPVKDESPSWSPDATKIAFSSNRTGTWQIFVISPDGTNVTELTPDESRGGHIAYSPQRTQPTWSPDGTQIAYTQEGIPGPTDVYVMNADGSGRHLAISSANSPSWQPIASMAPQPPTAEIPVDPCVTHESRQLDFSLRGRKFKGTVEAPSFGCYRADIKIERRAHRQWEVIRWPSTDSEGHFAGKISQQDRTHRAYRAVVPRSHWSSIPGARARTACHRATSAVVERP